MKLTIILIVPVLVLGACFTSSELEPGSSYENDWQAVPADIQRTADRLELGLPVHALEAERYSAYLEGLTE